MFLGRKASTRIHAQSLKSGDLFSQIPGTYDPFVKDIAIVKIIYKKPSVFLIGSKATMTWIDYLSNVGEYRASWHDIVWRRAEWQYHGVAIPLKS